jgi:putative effector of murein hydrolase
MASIAAAGSFYTDLCGTACRCKFLGPILSNIFASGDCRRSFYDQCCRLARLPDRTAMTIIIRDTTWIGATLAIFFCCRAGYMRWPHAALHPVLWSTILVVGVLAVTRYPRSAFQAETQPSVWLLGPAVVAMGLPVWQQRKMIAENWRMFSAVISASLLLSVGTILLLSPLLGPDMGRALAIKSVTAPVALGIAGQTGLHQDLVVVGVMTSGLFGLVMGPVLLAFGGFRGDRPEFGAALGCASH